MGRRRSTINHNGRKDHLPGELYGVWGGSKLNGPSWTINATNATWPGTLTDGGVNASKRFSTSNDVVPKWITWSDGTQPGGEGEMQLQFNADQVGGSTATNDPTPTLPTCINTAQRPPSIPCNVSCTWDLVKQ